MQTISDLTGITTERAEGRAEGRTEEKVEIARKMKEAGMDIASIATLTGLSVDEIASIFK